MTPKFSTFNLSNWKNQTAFRRDGQDCGIRLGLWGEIRSSDLNIQVEMPSGQLDIQVCSSGGEVWARDRNASPVFRWHLRP